MNIWGISLGIATVVIGGGCSSQAEPTVSKATDAGSQADLGTEVDSGSAVDSGAADSKTEEDSAVGDGSVDTGADAQPACIPIEPNPGKTASGYALDGWSWERKGIIAEASSAVKLDGYIAPAIVVAESKLHLFATKKTGLTHRIYHGVSVDGESFSELKEVAGLGGDDVIANPSVSYASGKFRMWYGSGGIDYAESSDGESFVGLKKTVIGPSGGSSFDSLSVLYPSVVQRTTDYLMLYTGFDGQRFTVGAAMSADGLIWQKSADLGLSQGPANEFDNKSVAQPNLVAGTSGLLMWYGGYDISKSNPGPYRIGLAQSTDGKAWKKIGVSLELSASGVEAYSTRDPSVLRWNGQWIMVYCAMGDDSKYRLMLARSSNCEPI